MRGPKPITYAREVYSPSQLELADRCLRSWVLRYIYGIKTQSAASRSKVLGVLIHKCVEIYLHGRSMLSLSVDDFDDYTNKEFAAFRAYRQQVLLDKLLKKHPNEHHAHLLVSAQEQAQREFEDLLREAPQRALAGLAHLPPLEQCAAVHAELPLEVSTTDFWDYDVQFSEMSKIDLVAQAADGELYLYDHKSTKGKPGNPWAYVPTPEKLKQSVQLLLYAASVMQRAGIAGLWCRWVYYYTGEGAADSKAVDVYVTYAEVAELLQPWLKLADELGVIIRCTHEFKQLPPLESFEFPVKVNTDDSPCDAYAGCGYRGGHCHPPPLSVEQVLAKTRSKQREKKESSMGLDDRVAQQQANGAPVLPSVTPMKNPAGFQYVPNVNGQYVPAPPGHPAHSGVPAGYQYPPGGVEIATGVVEVPQHAVTDAAAKQQLADECASAGVFAQPEKPKRTRRTKAEIQAEIEAHFKEQALPRLVDEQPVQDEPDPKDWDAVLNDGLVVPSDDGAMRVVGLADAALEALSQKSKSLGCDVQVNFSFKGAQS